jgi:hypothetical protein
VLQPARERRIEKANNAFRVNLSDSNGLHIKICTARTCHFATFGG